MRNRWRNFSASVVNRSQSTKTGILLRRYCERSQYRRATIKRVLLHRVVRRVGGRVRGGLGGWIVPLGHVDEALRTELEHSRFPWKFPDTTTGAQALAYIREVWSRARSQPDGLANQVRDVLPTAYTYCLEDCTDEPSLAKRWQDALPEAAVFTEREWTVLAGENNLYFDDINDRRFLPSKMHVQTVTGGHLGSSHGNQVRTARELGLRLLSSSIEMKWRSESSRQVVDDEWGSRFDIILRLLRWVQDRKDDTRLTLVRVPELVLEVGMRGSSAERVPVNARLQENILTVAGRPVQFGPDAAKELLLHFSFAQ